MKSQSQTGKINAKGIDDALNANMQIQTTTQQETIDYLDRVKKVHSIDSEKESSKLQEAPWEIDPIELQDDNPLPDLSLENFPEVLRQSILDTCQNLHVPIIFSFTAVIAAISGIVGSAFRLAPKKYDKSWTVIPNMWGILIGPPSVKKTPTLELGLKPIKHIDKIEDEKFKAQKVEWDTVESKLKAERDGILDAIKAIARGEHGKNNLTEEELQIKLSENTIQLAKAPKRRVLKTNDATQEALLGIEAINRNGVTLHRDELVGWMSKLESDKEGAKQFFMEGHNGGQSYRSNRVTKEGPATTSHTITIVGTTQPRPYGQLIKQMKNNPFAEDGFTQRFQFAALYKPKSIGPISDIRRDPIAEIKLIETCTKIYSWVENILENEEEFFQVSNYTDEAQDYANEVQLKINQLATENEDNSHYYSHVLKSPKSLHGLALLFELLKQALYQSEYNRLVDLDSLQMAWKCIEVYLKHAEKIYQLDQVVNSDSSNELLNRIKSKEIVDLMTLREIKRKNWKHLRTDESLKDAISELEMLGWCRIEKIKKSRGAPSDVLRIHPSFRD